jgi:hypothetical protein
MPENINLRRIFLITLIGSVVTSAVVGIGVILFGDFGSFEVRILMTTLTVTAMSILGMACGAYLESGRGRLLPFLGIGLSIVSALMIFLIIWDLLDDSEMFIKSTISASLLATSCSHLSLISLARLDKRFIWSRITAFVCVWTLTAILLYILWFEPNSTSDLVLRIIGILSILIAAITIMTPVFHKLSVGNAGTAAIDAEIEKLKARIEELEAEKARLATNGQPAEIS